MPPTYFLGKLVLVNLAQERWKWSKYNKFMFEELSQLLRDTPKKQLSQTEVGRSLDLLRQLPHFQELNSKFGADYLVLMLPTLQTFILREGFWLIDECDHYMLIEGLLSEEEARYQASRPVPSGKVLDLLEKSGVRFLAKSDCKMIRIKKGPSAGFHFEKKLISLERQRKKTFQQMQVLLGGQNYKQRYEFLQKVKYFNSLGQFDFLELASKSHIQDYNQGNVTHKQGEPISKIGCILAGKIKLSYPANKQQGFRDKGIHLYRQEGDWLGLEQFLWQQQFKTNGEASSIVAMVVWVPRDIFQRKFNLKTNYQLINRLKGLIEAKKAMMERSLKCRRQKIMDIEQQTQDQKPISNKLLEKISTFQLIHERPRNNIRRTKNCKDIQVPELIMHRINFNAGLLDLSELPTIKEKLNLFPEAYRNVPISYTHLKEMQRLEGIKNKSLQPKTSRTYIQKNPEQFYQTILQKIPRKFKPSPSQFMKTVRQEKTGVHYNMSIYNNFRVGKQRVLSPTMRKFKTLDFLPKKDHKY